MEIVLSTGYAVLAAIVYCVASVAQKRLGGADRIRRGGAPLVHAAVSYLSAIVAAAAVLGLSLAIFGRMPSVGGTTREPSILLIQTGVIFAIALVFRLAGGTRRGAGKGGGPPDSMDAGGRIAGVVLLVVFMVPAVAVEELTYRGFIRLAFPRSPTVFTIVSAVLFAISRYVTDGLRPPAIRGDGETADDSGGLKEYATTRAPIVRRMPTAVGALFLGIALAFTYALSASLPAVLILHFGVELADRAVVGKVAAPGTESATNALFVITASVAVFLLTGWWYLLA